MGVGSVSMLEPLDGFFGKTTETLGRSSDFVHFHPAEWVSSRIH
jgi:hypothetical protein